MKHISSNIVNLTRSVKFYSSFLYYFRFNVKTSQSLLAAVDEQAKEENHEVIFNFDVRLCPDVCNNEDLIATSDLQLIFSPNFPRNYPNNVHCTSHITSPEDTVIELTFYHFQLEDSDDCNKDSLSVRIENNSNHRHINVTIGIFHSEPFGLRIDVNSRLLYWTDAELGTISVSNLDGEYRNTIIHTELDKPGAIVTEPYKGYIYFTDWGTHPKIERADGDGRNRLVLVNSDIVSPRSLAVDLKDVVVPDTCPRADCDWLCLPTPNGQHTCLSDDTTPPVFLNCPENIIIWVAPGVSSSQVSWDDVSLEDDVDVIISSSHLSGSTFRLGTETVKIAARDFAGNMAWCNFSATVIEDNSPPVIISCPSDISVSLSSSAETRQIVTWDEPVLSDNAGDAYWLVGPSSSGTAFPIGSTHITYVASDRFGNQAQCSFTVTVSGNVQLYY
ncbi:Low-density lipoprotein receptor-related protein 6 [Holothuria leucospilota]|uniref:Low-density lipoprotein receptor-related protein 6 n=1 Tax=Holothuria leucospilota TaxID=206669 RepID=A0A9Q1C5M1_HOLLE|nr:Low-density lipoprotein receptor-related protein 6 [Holothuria leucospilota]